MATITDLFNRADGALGTGWAEFANLTIVSSAAVAPAATYGYAFNDASLATDDMRVAVVVTAGTESMTMSMRAGEIGTGTDDMVSCSFVTGETASIGYTKNGVDTAGLAFSENVVTWATGDTLWFEAVGSIYAGGINSTTLFYWQDPGNASYANVNATHRQVGFATQSATANHGADSFTATDITAHTNPWPGPTVVAAATSTLTASTTPTLTFPTSWIPTVGDVVLLIPSSTIIGGVPTAPAGWVNPLGGTVDVESDSHELAVVYHVVTTAEATAATRTYSPVLYSVAQTGNTAGVVLRGVDTAAIIDSVATGFSSTNTATPHVLPALVGANLSTNSIVIGVVVKDTTGTYTTPEGYGLLASSNVNQGKAVYAGVLPTIAGTAKATGDATPSAGDEYCAITLAFSRAAGAALTSTLTDPVGITDALSSSLSGSGALTANITDPVGIHDSVAGSLGVLTFSTPLIWTGTEWANSATTREWAGSSWVATP